VLIVISSGNRVAHIGRALGMKVILTERKGIPRDSVREGRVHFEEALKLGTVFMLTLPLEPSTWNLITAKEFA
jgi:glycerate dehydrogenase